VTRGRAAAALALLAAAALAAWWLRPPGRTLFVGGPIVTLDASDRVVEALLVEGERIAAVGTEAELRARAAGARVVDLGGRTLLPGFIDAHGHFPGAGLTAVFADLNAPPIGEVATLDALVARLAERAARTPRGEWVLGIGYDDTLLAERRHPTREDLDRASREHPIAVWHVSGHLAAVSSTGLAALGYGRDTPDPTGGRIRRDAAGAPNGVLEETAAEPLQPLFEPGPLDALRIVRRASALYAAAGVTTAQNGFATRAQMTGLAWLSRLGLVPIRLVLWPSAETADAILDGSFRFRSWDERWVRVGAVKLVADGSIQGYTAYLSQPYHVPPGDDREYRGYPTLPRDELFERVARYHAAGWQVAVHANGDAAIDAALDAFEAAQRARPRADARPVVVHAQMTRDDQLDRMRALGVVPSFFALHTFYWGDRHRAIFLGPERAARISPTRGALARGVRFTLHCDTPVVPMEPLRLVWAAVNRRSTGGAEIGPEQRIDAARALRAVTIDAAWQHFEDGEKGSLEPGKLADLVVLDRSPLAEPASLDRIRVVETIVGGRTIFRAPE
jgi:predicted amidohydrolase YtcJ